MSELGSKFLDQGSHLVAKLGDAGTYTPAGASGIAVALAIFQKFPDAGDERSRASLIIPAALVPVPSSSTRRGDKWANTGQSDLWTVTDYEDNLDGYLILQLAMPRAIGS